MSWLLERKYNFGYVFTFTLAVLSLVDGYYLAAVMLSLAAIVFDYFGSPQE